MLNPPKYYDIKINVVHVNDCVTHLIKPCKCQFTTKYELYINKLKFWLLITSVFFWER